MTKKYICVSSGGGSYVVETTEQELEKTKQLIKSNNPKAVLTVGDDPDQFLGIITPSMDLRANVKVHRVLLGLNAADPLRGIISGGMALKRKGLNVVMSQDISMSEEFVRDNPYMAISSLLELITDFFNNPRVNITVELTAEELERIIKYE